MNKLKYNNGDYIQSDFTKCDSMKNQKEDDEHEEIKSSLPCNRKLVNNCAFRCRVIDLCADGRMISE